MNSQEAKEILSLYRPGSADAQDPAFAEALRLCRQDAELEQWFAGHCAVYSALRAKFKQTPIPEGLKEQIIAERKVHTVPMWQRRSVILAAVAVIAVLTGLVSITWPTHREDFGFDTYKSRMTGIALVGYAMDFPTNNAAEIQAYLASHNAPSDVVLPEPLKKTTLTGCAIRSWQGARVSMICFHSGKPLPSGQSSDLWLFVADSSSISGAPASTVPVIAGENRAMTACWTSGGKTYLLVTDGDEAFLKKYL
jgi:hypothetical protein